MVLVALFPLVLQDQLDPLGPADLHYQFVLVVLVVLVHLYRWALEVRVDLVVQHLLVDRLDQWVQLALVNPVDQEYLVVLVGLVHQIRLVVLVDPGYLYLLVPVDLVLLEDHVVLLALVVLRCLVDPEDQ